MLSQLFHPLDANNVLNDSEKICTKPSFTYVVNH
jgi:hypothetical protein